VVYNTPGNYTVSLTVTNTAGSDTETKTAYITVLANTNPPVADFVASATTITVGGSVNFTDLSTNTPNAWAWSFTGGTPATSTIQNPTNIVYNAEGLYQVSLTATNAYGNDIETKTAYINVTAPIYCDGYSNSTAYEYISNVSVSTINNTTPATQYSDFTNITTNITQGASYPFTITGSSTYATDQVLIWIDWNMDGDFDDTGENVFTSSASVGPYTGSFTVPAASPTGSTRMRIRMHDTNTSYTPNPNPCGASGYGEVEDYTVNIISLNMPPVAIFSASPVSTCNGIVQFTDESTGNATSWLWNFGDGQTATTQNPSHTYTASGNYSVSLTATNANGSDTETQTDLIVVSLPTAPTTTGGTRCGTGVVTLTAAGSATLEWYDVPTGGTSINTGTTFVTPSLSTTTTYYVESNASAVQTVGHTASTTNGATNTSASYLTFDVFEPLTILSVEVNNTGAAGNKIISLQNSAGTNIDTRTVNVPAGVSRIDLGFDVPVGTAYRLTGPANSNLYRNDAGVVYPYTIPGLVSITGTGAGAQYYYYFYKWYVVPQITCISARTPAVATIEQAVTPSITISANNTSVCSGTTVTLTPTVQNAGTTPTYQWTVNGVAAGTSSTLSTPITANSTVTCTLTSSLTCTSANPVTSSPVTITVSTPQAVNVAVTTPVTTICEGQLATFTAVPSNGGTTPAYQWYVNAQPVGTNSATFSSSTLTNASIVTCQLTSSLGCTTNNPATSTAVNMTVTSNIDPQISIVSSTMPVCSGQNITFTANTTQGGTSPAYQWFVNGNSVGTGTTYASTTLSDNDEVYCTLSVTEVCTENATVNSNIINVDISPATTPTLVISTLTPNVCTGESITFTATPTNGGNTPSYQWQVNGSNAGTNSSSFTSSTLVDGDLVTCVLTSNDPCANPVNSTSNSIEVNIESSLILSADISGPTSICQGENATYVINTSNAGSTPVYQWTLNGNNTGSNTPNLSSTGFNNGDIIGCTVYSSLGCVSNSPVIASTYTVIVSASASVTVTIDGTSNLCTSEIATFNASSTNEGTTPVYDWTINGISQGINNAVFTSSTLSDGDVVGLTLTASGSCITNNPATANTITVNVDDHLTAGFTYTPNELEISFFSSITNADYYYWSFGDGNNSTEQNPVHTYSADGMYIVTHSVVNACDSVVAMQSVNAVSVGMSQVSTNNNISVYPNPSQGILNISSDLAFQNITIKMTDVAGRVVYLTSNQYQKMVSINISRLEKGIYFLDLLNPNGETINSSSIKIVHQ
ncbi:MAG: hypothetical protein CVU05_10910, partial [Bacteroidetes bacterium HGW-Bacteroidetes-21]